MVVGAFAPIRERTEKLLADEAELDRLLAAGSVKAHDLAAPTMARVRDRVGFLPAAIGSAGRWSPAERGWAAAG